MYILIKYSIFYAMKYNDVEYELSALLMFLVES